MHSLHSRSRHRRAALATVACAVLSAQATTALAVDVSPPAILQWFESSYNTIENRTADAFVAGYGAVWTPPPGRADISNFSVGYDVYDRFDLGSANNKTLYGTETGIKTVANTVHRAGLDLHVDFVLNHNGYSGTGNAESRENFKNAGGYPGFFTEFFGDVDGDFNSAYDYGDVQGRLAGLIDIDHNKNYRAVRNPVPGVANNIGAGTTPWSGRLANVPSEDNRRFYPDRNGPAIFLFDPITGEQNIARYSFNTSERLAGDPTEENALGYLMRNAQWLVQVVGVDGLRIDAAKHVDGFVLDYLDRAVYRTNPRLRLDGSTNHVFSYSEVFDGNPQLLLSHVKKNINPADPGRIGGNRDTLDFKLYFALKDNLEQTGTSNAWQNIKNSSIDFADDGLHNGSAGVKFVHNHDVFKPFALNDVAHAYVMMMPGNATVYFNGKEFGDNRDFPKEGRGDALSVGRDGVGGAGSTLTKLLEIRNSHGRGNYDERWGGDSGLFAFEREGSSVVLLSNRGDAGFDSRTLQDIDLAEGTYLIELTGNAADPNVNPERTAANGTKFKDIPEVIQVFRENGTNKVNVRFQRPSTVMPNGDFNFHGKGFLVYGLPTPQSTNGLEVSNVSQTLAGDATPTNNFENGTQRQTDLKVVTSDTFTLRLQTNEVRLLGTIRDEWADGDNALFKIDGGRDFNGNGSVDFVTPGGVTYGFERFVTKSEPRIGPGGLSAPRGDGEFLQTINAANLEEGYHYITARAFRHRTDGGPAVFTDWKQVIYVDRLKPISTVDSMRSWDKNHPEDKDMFIRSVDLTANSVHVFMDLPAAFTDAQILGFVNGTNKASQIDRDLFKYAFFDMFAGNHVATVVTYEITGNVNVQRIPNLFVSSRFGSGMGDATFDGLFTQSDVDAMFDLVTSDNTLFNPAGDFTGDGLMSYGDWQAFGAELNRLHGLAIPGPGGSQIVTQDTIDYFNEQSQLVPEPAALGTFIFGAAAFGLLGRRRRQSA